MRLWFLSINLYKPHYSSRSLTCYAPLPGRPLRLTAERGRLRHAVRPLSVLADRLLVVDGRDVVLVVRLGHQDRPPRARVRNRPCKPGSWFPLPRTPPECAFLEVETGTGTEGVERFPLLSGRNPTCPCQGRLTTGHLHCPPAVTSRNPVDHTSLSGRPSVVDGDQLSRGRSVYPVLPSPNRGLWSFSTVGYILITQLRKYAYPKQQQQYFMSYVFFYR